MKKQTTIALIAVTICLLAGVLPSLLSGCWSFFARSGALLVLIGAYIAWQDIYGNIDNMFSKKALSAQQSYADKYNEITGIIRRAMEKESLKTELHERILEIEQEADQQKKSFKTIEALLIGAGTMIWAYGDLIGGLNC